MKNILLFCLIASSAAVNKDPLAITSVVFEQINQIVQDDVAKKYLKKLLPSLETSVPVFGTFIVAGFSFAGVVNDEADIKLDQILEKLEKLDKIDEKVDGVSNQIHRLNNLISNEHDRTIGLVKMERIIPVLAAMSAKEEKLPTLISTYQKNTPQLINELEKFILNYEQEDYETKLVQQLFINFPGYKSLVKESIDIGRKYQTGDLIARDSNTSTQKAVYDLTFAMLMRIMRGFDVLKIAAALKFKLSNETDTSQLDYAENKKVQTLNNFFTSLKSIMANLNDEGDVSSFISFATTPNELKFKFVFQTFFDDEAALSKIDTCSDDCPHFTYRRFNHAGCDGYVRDCQSASKIKIDYANSSDERLYHGFKYNKIEWQGKGSESKALGLNGWTRGFYACETCKCLCDQSEHYKSVRKIYVGKFSAPEGFVITGVRFKEEIKAVYLQPQVGKLLPMGLIDSSTIKWMEIPSNVDNDDFSYIIYGNDNSHSIELGVNNKKFNDGRVVTGIQLTRGSDKRDQIRLDVIGKELLSFGNGTLGSNEDSAKWIYNPHNYLNLGKNVGLNPTNNNFMGKDKVWLKFTQSDEEIDAGQSFVPYFDAADVTFDQPAPLSMIGLVHYTNDKNYAGYIRPIIKSLDYKNFV